MATYRKIFDLALAKMFERKGTDSDYDEYAAPILEGLLIEALPYENMIRRQKGVAVVEAAPEVDAVDETVLDWDDRITRNALPWGLASGLLAMDEIYQPQAAQFRNNFVDALSEAAPAVVSYTDEEVDDA